MLRFSASAGPLMANYAQFATWAVSKAPPATGWVSNGTIPPEASIRASIKESDISSVRLMDFPRESSLIQLAGKNDHPTAGSFVRPSRPSEPPRSFLEALREKYASEFEQSLAQDAGPAADRAQKAIEISGKVVEEVGFDKIRKQLAELQELRIVLLDGLRVAGVLSSYDQPEDQVKESAKEIMATCPKIIELDLSRNLLSRWRDVWEICNQLKQLKRLKVK